MKIENVKILETIEVSLENLTKNLKSLNISKASGPDGINARILRETADQLAPALKIMFEKSLDEGTLPYQWKEAHVVALFKKGIKRDANNYRPVSLTSICGKLLEKIVRDNIVKTLESQGLIHKDQHGFRGGRSCCTVQGWGQLHNINSTPTPEVSTPTPTPANLQNINSNSNFGGFNSNSNSNSGKSPEYQLQLQFQLRRFQLQFQLQLRSFKSNPNPISNPIHLVELNYH